MLCRVWQKHIQPRRWFHSLRKLAQGGITFGIRFGSLRQNPPPPSFSLELFPLRKPPRPFAAGSSSQLAFQPKRSDRVNQARASGIDDSGKAEAEQAFRASP